MEYDEPLSEKTIFLKKQSFGFTGLFSRIAFERLYLEDNSIVS